VYQYCAHVRYFFQFCVYANVGVEDPSEELFCAYAAYLARSVKAATVRQYLKGLRDLYKARGQPHVGDALAWPRLYKVLKGIDRVKGTDVSKKRPVTPAMLLAMRRMVEPAEASHLALWACTLVSFFGFFRKSNVTAKSGSLWSDGKCIRRMDVRADARGHALAVTPPGSKTRQTGKAPEIYIEGLRGHPLDPFEAWEAHSRASGDTPSGLLTAFAYKTGAGRWQALSHALLVQWLKAAAHAVGVPASEVAGHSLRRGGATWAFRMGARAVLIKAP